MLQLSQSLIVVQCSGGGLLVLTTAWWWWAAGLGIDTVGLCQVPGCHKDAKGEELSREATVIVVQIMKRGSKALMGNRQCDW